MAGLDQADFSPFTAQPFDLEIYINGHSSENVRSSSSSSSVAECNAELANSGANVKAKGTKLKQVCIVKWLWRFLLRNLASLNRNLSKFFRDFQSYSVNNRILDSYTNTTCLHCIIRFINQR